MKIPGLGLEISDEFDHDDDLEVVIDLDHSVYLGREEVKQVRDHFSAVLDKDRTAELEWDHEATPTEDGWYAVMYSWSSREGSFLGTSKWSGNKWDTSKGCVRELPIFAHSSSPFTTEEDAEKWGEENDHTF